MLNPNAEPYIPTKSFDAFEGLKKTPFFQQRFERFLHTILRDYVGTTESLQVFLMDPPMEATKKAKVQFLAMYKHHVIVYESNGLHDPRSGHFYLL